LASEEKTKAYIIFHNSTLREIVEKLPTDLEALRNIAGVGDAKLEKYGVQILRAVQSYLEAAV
jgi:ATP-dependent DNA helicase RecQ